MVSLDGRFVFQNKQIDITAVGEMIIDMICADYDDNVQCDTYHRSFGGAPSNIAMNVQRLGLRPLIAAAVGQDGFGTYLMNRLETAGVDTRLVQRVSHSTSLVVLTRSKATPVPIFYRGADYHLKYTEDLENAIRDSKLVHFSSWPISREPARQTMEQVISTARRYDTLLCFDPNYHEMLWSNNERGIDYVKSIIEQVDIVKPSEDDAERLFGKDTPLHQVQKLLRLGAKLVIMTLGERGALVSNGTETIELDAMAEEVVDATGAGDAFWSGFYTGLLQGHTVRRSLRLGMAVSAYKLRHVGAVAELPGLPEIERMYGIREGLA